MKKLRFYISHVVLVFILFVYAKTNGQDMLGVAFSNYSGVSSAAINPAFLTGTRVFMDVNIFSGNVNMANNMIYFAADNNTISKGMRLDTSLFRHGNFDWGRSYNYYNNTQDKYVTTSVKLLGPSMMIQADRHAFGFTTALRSFNSGNHIPYEIPMILYEGLSDEQFHNQPYNDYNYDFVSLTWSEIGLSYAYNFYDIFSNRFTFGVSLKALFGHEGGYMNMRNLNFEILNSRDINFKNVDLDVGYALPYSYTGDYMPDYDPIVKGYGAGFDFGLVYTKLKSTVVYERDDKLCARPYNDYKYKIGISLLDVGAITFTSDTELHEFHNVSRNWVEYDTTHFRGIQYNMGVYSKVFLGDSTKSFAGDKITVGLPATISVQFDYHLKQRIYLAALWMHPLRFNSRTVWRPSQIAFIPRYENRYFGVSMPFSLFNYTDPRLGIAVRVYSITLGTDRLGSLLGLSNFNGMDFYFSFRFNIGKGACASSTRGACNNADFGGDW